MSEPTLVTSGVAGRYATALFKICEEDDQIGSLQKDVGLVSELLENSNDFNSLINSPVYRREQQEAAVSAIADHMKVLKNTKNLLCLLAQKGRLFILPDFIYETNRLLDRDRDEIAVEVFSAVNLTNAQVTGLEKSMSKLVGKKAKVGVQKDESLISGIIIKLGSKMIDTTTKSKLLKLRNLMKEVN